MQDQTPGCSWWRASGTCVTVPVPATAVTVKTSNQRVRENLIVILLPVLAVLQQLQLRWVSRWCSAVVDSDGGGGSNGSADLVLSLNRSCGGDDGGSRRSCSGLKTKKRKARERLGLADPCIPQALLTLPIYSGGFNI